MWHILRTSGMDLARISVRNAIGRAAGCSRDLARSLCVLAALAVAAAPAFATPQNVDVTLTSTVNPTVTGQSTTLTATVGAPGTPPEGTFYLCDDIGAGSCDAISAIDSTTVNTTGAGNTTGIGTSLGLGLFFTCAVTDVSGAKCWGQNNNGQLGNGGGSDSHVPIDVSGLNGVRALASGATSSCALLSDGTIKCWGLAPGGNGGGNSGYMVAGSTPFTLGGVSNARMIAEGGLETDDVVCAVTTDDALKCAGLNSYISAETTTTIAGLESGVGSVALSDAHACVVMVDGSVECWGAPGTGSDAAPSTTPATVSGLPAATTAVTAGYDFSCALLTTGAVWCWGDNAEGELGNNDSTHTTSSTPVDTGLSNVVAITSGNLHSCALISDGSVKCWGYNFSGQIGDNSTTNRLAPVSVSTLSAVSAIAAGGDRTCAITNTGVTKCWGANSNGGVGDNSTMDRYLPTAVNGTPAVKLYGQATFTRAFATLGSHSLTAQFVPGNSALFNSGSAPLTQTVTVATTSTGISLVAGNNPSQFADNLTFKATVSANLPGNGFPTGTVDFMDGSDVIATGTLSGGEATWSTTALALGTHTITAVYESDGNYATSTSGSITQTVSTAATATALDSSDLSPMFGESVTFTATVTSPAGTPTGGVSFKDGGSEIATRTLSGGVATFATSALPVGPHTITVDYAGDGTYLVSSSAGRSFTVNKGSTTTVLVAKDAQTPADTVGAIATVAPVAPSAGTATGSVEFFIDNVSIGTVALTSGKAAFRRKLAAGSHSIGATYSSDPNFSASSATPVNASNLNNKAATTTTLTALSPSPNSYGGATSVRVDVSTAAGGPATGSVIIKDGANVLGTVNLDAFNPASAFSAGEDVTCVIGAGGGAQCFGSNKWGILGGGFSSDNSVVPVNVLGLTTGAQWISASSQAPCGITAGGGVKCWGLNNFGNMGNGEIETTTQVNDDFAYTPADVVGLTTGASAVEVSEYGACALTTAGGVKCWGLNETGRLGTTDDPTFKADTPVDVVGLSSGVKTLGQTCVIMTAGGVKCWGDNSVGELGIGTADTNAHLAADVPGLSGVVGLTATTVGGSVCALMNTGGVKCWGRNDFGELGTGSSDSDPHPTPTDVPGLADVVQISGNVATICALTSGGAVKCWGDNAEGTLGIGTTDSAPHPPVDAIGLDETIVAISVGSEDVCALTTSGGLKCWGVNSSGELGVPVGPPDPNLGFDIRTTPVDAVIPAIPLRTTVTFSSSALGGGSHNITATYNGDAAHTGSTSAALTQPINNAPTTTTVVSSANPTVTGQAVTFTATVNGSGAPGGTVTFKDGTTMIGSPRQVSGGQASLTISTLPFGSHSITASYSGDTFFNASSTAAPLTQFVKGTTTLTASATPATAKPGQAVTLKATIAVTAPTSATPTGSVSFKEGTKTIGASAVSSKNAQISTSSLTLGTHVITATYGGDGNLTGSATTTTAKVSAAAGSETQVNTTTAGAQQLPAVAALKSGYVIAWASSGQDKSGYGVYIQRYTRAGATAGGETLVNTDKTGDQTMPAVAGLKSGSFVVVWQSAGEDKSGLGVYGQIFTAAGAKSGVEFKVNTTTSSDQSLPSVAPLSSGGFVVAWTSKAQDKSGLGVYAQLYDAKGKVSGTEFKVNTTTTGDQSNPSVAGLTGGGFVVSWQGPDANGLGIYMQRYDATGKAQGKETLVNKTTLNDQSLPAIAPLDNGGYVIAWQSALQDGSGLGVYMQRFTAAGSKTGNEVLVNTTTANDQSTPSVSGFSDGGYVVAWASKNQDGSGLGVYAQAFNDAGAKVNAEFLVNTTTLGDQSQPAVAAMASGNFVAAWTSANDGSGQGIYSQRFTVPGTH